MTDDPKTPAPTTEPPARSSSDPVSPAEGEQGKEQGKEQEPAPQRRAAGRRPRWGLRLLVLLVLIALLLLLLWWKHCLPGQGGGGKQSAPEPGPATMAGGGGETARGTPCVLRVDAKGITVAGKPVSGAAAAVKACGEAKRAVLRVTGDARFGTAQELGKALRAADITVQRKQ